MMERFLLLNKISTKIKFCLLEKGLRESSGAKKGAQRPLMFRPGLESGGNSCLGIKSTLGI